MELIRRLILFFLVFGFTPQVGFAAALNQQVCSSHSGLLKSFGFTNDWQFLESTGTTAIDSIGGDTGTYMNAPTLAQPGPLAQPSKSIVINGTNQYVTTANTYVGPNIYTLLAWFKTSTGGGRFIGLGDLQDGNSNNYDRILFFNDSGQVVFGAYDGSTAHVALSGVIPMNDNNWHLAIGTMDATNGMLLYLDGTLVGSNSNTLSQSFTGYWRIGFDSNNDWPYASATEYFNGNLGEVAVASGTALTAAQVQELYSIGTACSGVYKAPATIPAKTLTFSPSSISSTAYTCNQLTINSNWYATLLFSGTTVNLSSTGSSTTFYSDSFCATPITSITIPLDTNTVTVYVQDTAAETTTLTASSAGYTSATLTSTTTASLFKWTGAGGNANWSNGANWSGGNAPGAYDQAVFGSCSSNCSPVLDINVDVGSVFMQSNYTGTITQPAGKTFTIEGPWQQYGGNFVGGNSAMGGFNADFTINGGTFTATSAATQVRNWQVNGGTFSNNNGNINFTYTSGTMAFTPGSNHYYDVTFSGAGYNVASVSGYPSVYIDHSLVLSGGGANLSNLIFEVYGNVICSGTGFGLNGGTRIQMDGNAAGQTITGVPGCDLPEIVINAGTNHVTYSGTIQTRESYQVNSVGTLTTTGSTLIIYNPGAAMIPGTVTYNNVTFASTGSWNWGNLNGGTMTVAGNLVFDGGGNTPTLDNGTILVSGNVSAKNNGYYPYNGSNSLNVKLTGNPAGQTVSTTTWDSVIPALEIATGTYPVTFGTNVGIGDGNFTMTSVGTFNVTGSTLYLQSFSIYPGTATYNNVNLEVGSTTRTLNGGTMNVAGNFTIDDTGGTEIDSGTVNVSGNFIKTGGVNSSGSLAIKMVGTSNATITTDSTYLPGSTFTINKPGKTVTLSSYLYLIMGGSQSLTLTAGSLNMAGQFLMANSMSLNSTTVTKGGGVLNVGGTAIGTGSFFGGTIAP